PEHEIFQRDLDVIENHLAQVLAAHGVKARPRGEPFHAAGNQRAAYALRSRHLVDAREDDEHFRDVGARDQRLHAVHGHAVALYLAVGGVAGNVGPGVGLRHADREYRFAGCDARQDAPLDGFRRVGGDDARLDAQLTKGGHRGHVAHLADLLEDEDRVEYSQSRAAVFLRHRHAEHADFRELLHVLRRPGAVEVLERAFLEAGLAHATDAVDECTLLFADVEIHVLAVNGGWSKLSIGES